MKRVVSPPELDSILLRSRAATASESVALMRLIQDHGDPTPRGRYRHWDRLRHLQAPDGLDHESWWLAIKMARSLILKPIPLLDTSGRAFHVGTPDVLHELIHQIDRQASGVIGSDGHTGFSPDQRFILMGALEEEAIRSSQLEGAATTRRVAKVMIREKRQPRNRSERMILNNHRGMELIRSLDPSTPLDPELIFRLHRVLTEGTLDNPETAGRFRRATEEEDIAVIDDQGAVLHDPPRAEELPARLHKLCEFANETEGSPFIHPVVRSVLLHFWLAYDHPFVDGNGRTARAIFYWSMAKHGYWLMQYASISRLLLNARARYVRAFLYSETDDNDATYFVLHQCETILTAIKNLHRYIDEKRAEVRRTKDLLHDTAARGFDFNFRQLALLRYAIEHPGTRFSFKTHQGYHNISYQTAYADLMELVDRELMVRHRAGRAYDFVAVEDIEEMIK